MIKIHYNFPNKKTVVRQITVKNSKNQILNECNFNAKTTLYSGFIYLQVAGCSLSFSSFWFLHSFCLKVILCLTFILNVFALHNIGTNIEQVPGFSLGIRPNDPMGSAVRCIYFNTTWRIGIYTKSSRYIITIFFLFCYKFIFLRVII